jgi:hypothetical protein
VGLVRGMPGSNWPLATKYHFLPCPIECLDRYCLPNNAQSSMLHENITGDETSRGPVSDWLNWILSALFVPSSFRSLD